MNINGNMVVLDIIFNNTNNIKDLINNIEYILEDLDVKVIRKCKHVFPNNGMTVLYLLSASHLAIHTWPEYNLVTVDIFTCANEGNAVEISNTIIAKYSECISKISINKLPRGKIQEEL